MPSSDGRFQVKAGAYSQTFDNITDAANAIAVIHQTGRPPPLPAPPAGPMTMPTALDEFVAQNPIAPAPGAEPPPPGAPPGAPPAAPAVAPALAPEAPAPVEASTWTPEKEAAFQAQYAPPAAGLPPTLGPDGVPISAGGQAIPTPGGTRIGGRRGPSAGVETLIPGQPEAATAPGTPPGPVTPPPTPPAATEPPAAPSAAPALPPGFGANNVLAPQSAFDAARARLLAKRGQAAAGVPPVSPEEHDAAADQLRAGGDIAGAVQAGAAATQARLDAAGPTPTPAYVPPAPPVHGPPTPADTRQAAQLAEGVHPEDVAQAQRDITAANAQAKPTETILGAIRRLGGINLVAPDGVRNDISDEIDKQLKGVQPGTVKLTTGLSPQAMREALQTEGWFGRTDTRQSTYDPYAPPQVVPGDTDAELNALVRQQLGGQPVFHPDTTTAADAAQRARVSRDIGMAGVDAADHPIVQAATLAGYRDTMADAGHLGVPDKTGDWRDMRPAVIEARAKEKDLQARAAKVGVDPTGLSLADLEHDVIMGEARRDDYNAEKAAQHAEQIDHGAQLSGADWARWQAEHDALAEGGSFPSQTPPPAHREPPAGYEPTGPPDLASLYPGGPRAPAPGGGGGRPGEGGGAGAEGPAAQAPVGFRTFAPPTEEQMAWNARMHALTAPMNEARAEHEKLARSALNRANKRADAEFPGSWASKRNDPAFNAASLRYQNEERAKVEPQIEAAKDAEVRAQNKIDAVADEYDRAQGEPLHTHSRHGDQYLHETHLNELVARRARIAQEDAGGGAPAPVEPTGAEPWQQSREDFVREGVRALDEKTPAWIKPGTRAPLLDAERKNLEAQHFNSVNDAFKRGEDVPLKAKYLPHMTADEFHQQQSDRRAAIGQPPWSREGNDEEYASEGGGAALPLRGRLAAASEPKWDFTNTFPPAIDGEGPLSDEEQLDLHAAIGGETLRDLAHARRLERAVSLDHDVETDRPLRTTMEGAEDRARQRAQLADARARITGQMDDYERRYGPEARKAFEAFIRDGEAKLSDKSPGWAGRVPAPERPEPTTEKVDLANGPAEQGVMPGMEQSAKQAAAARGKGGLKAKKPQAEPTGLFAPPPAAPEPTMFPEEEKATAPAARPWVAPGARVAFQPQDLDRNHFAAEAARRKLKGPAAAAFIDGALREGQGDKKLVNEKGAIRERELDGHNFYRSEMGRYLSAEAEHLQDIADPHRERWEAALMAKYPGERLGTLTADPRRNSAGELSPLSWAYSDAQNAANRAWERASEYPRPTKEGIEAAKRAYPAAAEAPAAPPPLPADFGANNTLATKSDFDAAKARLDAKARGNQLNAGIDPQDLADGITMATYYLEGGARSFADYASRMLADLGEWVRPHLQSWYEAVRWNPAFEAKAELTPTNEITPDVIANVGKPNVLDQRPDLEPRGPGGAPQDGVRPEDISPGPGADEQRPQPGGGQPEGAGGAVRGGAGAGAGGPAPVGEPGDHGVRGQQPELPGYPPGPGDSVGGGEPGNPGVQPDNIGTESLGQTAEEASHVEPSPGQPDPTAIAPNEPKVVPPDLEAALPRLHPEQRSDVAFVEDRFAKPDGHGVMITNGTGTGKTWSGGGVIKRFWDKGKRNILVVAPSQGILDHWVKDMGKLAPDVRVDRLDDSSSNGREGHVILTTYANLGMNETLADRAWDLVVADEAHTLSSDQAGTTTQALATFRAITNHPRGLIDKARMLLRADAAKVEALDVQRKATRWPAREQVDQAWAAAHADLTAKAKALVEKLKGEPRSKAVLMSATPFSYDKSVDLAEGYLFDYGADPKTGAYNTPGAKDRFFMQHFGYRMRYNRLTKPDSAVESEVMERAFHEHLKRTGALTGRQLNLPFDYDRKFVNINSAVGKKIDQALQYLRDHEDPKMKQLGQAISKRFDYVARQRLLEAIKAEAAIPIIAQHIAMGRKVVVFHDFNEGGGFAPFALDDDLMHEAATLKITDNGQKRLAPDERSELEQAHAQFVADNPYVLAVDQAVRDLRSPINTLTGAYPEALVYNGTIPNKVRKDAIDKFQKDHSGHNLIVVQSQAGKQGISLHDTTGVHQRVLLNLGMPGRPTDAIQQEGRIYRDGQKSDAIFRYMNTGTNWERNAFAQTIAERSGTAENLAMGDRARTLRTSFINAFLDSDSYPPSKDDGVGGKENDARMASDQSAFDRAKSFYYAQSKKASGQRGREGTDYYATPEPLGLKMVEWAGIKPGDHVLEPSAGHGAIARSMPETSHRTAIEPSADLASRLRLAAPGANVKEQRFEDLHPNNKYDAVVMNPPFGHAGSTAVDHLARAANHLRNGGRIVALLPHGAADAKLEKFLESPAAKDLHRVGSVDLPASTFERAGTKVSTHVIILEKQTNPEDAARVRSGMVGDLSGAPDIKALFDGIEHAEAPPRVEPTTKEAIAPEQAAEAAALANHAAAQPPAAEPEQPPFTTTDHQGDAGMVYAAKPTKAAPKVQFADRMAMARSYGGRYMSESRAREGEPTGFHFDKPEQRDAFVKEATTGEKTALTGAADPTRSQFTPRDARDPRTRRPVFVASNAIRTDRAEYDRVATIAGRNGGRWGGRDGHNGFVFKTPEDRDKFIAEAHADPGEPAHVTAARAELARGLSGNRLNAGLPVDLLKPAATVIGHNIRQGFMRLNPLADKVRDAAGDLMDKYEGLGSLVHGTQKAFSPMALGSADPARHPIASQAKAKAKTFASTMREIAYEWREIDKQLKTFAPPRRKAMWDAADYESVQQQQGAPIDPTKGLASLSPEEREAVEQLMAHSQKVWAMAKELGMVKGEGLPSYVPRMLIAMANDNPTRLKGAKGAGVSGVDVGQNLITTTANLLPRKHLFTRQTEEAAQQHIDPSAEVVHDIRTLGLALAKMEQAIAGRHLIESIRAMAGLGVSHVFDGESDNTFTLNHPAFRTLAMDYTRTADGKWVPRIDQNGRPVWKSNKIYMSKDWEGPLRAVLSERNATDQAVNGLMSVKSLQMHGIMWSPFMHLGTVFGKTFAAAPWQVGTLQVFFNGYAARQDREQVKQAIRDGLAPAVRNMHRDQDLIGIAKGQTSAQLNKPEGITTKIGNFWHNTLLWDRVADVQMGLYTHIKATAMKDGMDEATAGKIAATQANLYVGSLPPEAMSKASRQIGNIGLFSRQFTLSNLAIMKSAVVGLPSEVQAQIAQESGPGQLAKAQAFTREKAVRSLMIDAVMARVTPWLLGGAIWAMGSAVTKMMGGQPQPFQSPDQNEPGKQDRAYVGTTSTGAQVFVRSTLGKVAQEMLNWPSKPVSTIDAKFAPLFQSIQKLLDNSTAPGKPWGHTIWDPDAKTPGDWAHNALMSGWTFIGDSLPIREIEGALNVLLPDQAKAAIAKPAGALGIDTGEDRWLGAAQTILPLFGLTVSKGRPGGPVEGAQQDVIDAHFQALERASTGIHAMIKDNDIAGASKALTALGVTGEEQKAYITKALMPPGQLTKGRQIEAARWATPADRANIAALQARARAMTPAPPYAPPPPSAYAPGP